MVVAWQKLGGQIVRFWALYAWVRVAAWSTFFLVKNGWKVLDFLTKVRDQGRALEITLLRSRRESMNSETCIIHVGYTELSYIIVTWLPVCKASGYCCSAISQPRLGAVSSNLADFIFVIFERARWRHLWIIMVNIINALQDTTILLQYEYSSTWRGEINVMYTMSARINELGNTHFVGHVW